MPRISDMARQRLMHMILEDIGQGLVDPQIIFKTSYWFFVRFTFSVFVTSCSGS